MSVEQRQLLVPVHGIIRVVDVEHDARGRPRKAATVEIDLTEPDTRQGSPAGEVLQRDNVGWLMRSAPVSGARPTAIFIAGSVRRASM